MKRRPVPVLAQRLIGPLLAVGALMSISGAAFFRMHELRENEEHLEELAHERLSFFHAGAQVAPTLDVLDRLARWLAVSPEVDLFLLVDRDSARILISSKTVLVGKPFQAAQDEVVLRALDLAEESPFGTATVRQGHRLARVERLPLKAGETSQRSLRRAAALLVLNTSESDHTLQLKSLWIAVASLGAAMAWSVSVLFLLRRHVTQPLAAMEDLLGERPALSDRSQDELTIFATTLRRALTEQKRVEEHLTTAKEAAEAGARAKSEFLATMSHEIRTPMNGVLGFTNLLLETKLTDDQREMVRTIATSGEALLVILNDILDFSKLESGKFTIEAIPFDLGALLRETHSLLKNRAAEKGLTLRLDAAKDLPSLVTGDPTRLRQVILNLLSNAIKFTESGYVTLQVAREGQLGRDYIAFSVQDTGIGLTESQRSKLFHKFVQADASTTRKYGGTGLGLAISKHLVELMGGTMGVKSEAGKGSDFHFALPLPRARGTERQVAIPIEQVGLTFDGLRVLVVDDTNTNQLLAERILKQMGCEVTLANNGLAALRQLKHERFDVVLMDCQMPEMDGFEATRSLRELERQNGVLPSLRTPVIALTANALTGDREACLAAGMDAYLTKPLRKEELRTCLGQTLTTVYTQVPIVSRVPARPLPRD